MGVLDSSLGPIISPLGPSLQPHLVQVNLALKVLEIQLQVKRGDPFLGDLDVSQVGNGGDILEDRQTL